MIRELTQEDVAEAARLKYAVFAYQYAPFCEPEKLTAWLDRFCGEKWFTWRLNRKTWKLFVYEADDKIVGLGGVKCENGAAYLSGICVDYNYQGQGVAKALTEHREKLARNASCNILRLYTFRDNERPAQMAKKRGYKKTGSAKEKTADVMLDRYEMLLAA